MKQKHTASKKIGHRIEARAKVMEEVVEAMLTSWQPAARQIHFSTSQTTRQFAAPVSTAGRRSSTHQSPARQQTKTDFQLHSTRKYLLLTHRQDILRKANNQHGHKEFSVSLHILMTGKVFLKKHGEHVDYLASYRKWL
jgi:hypothetical protein